jgi:hypothetical protein
MPRKPMFENPSFDNPPTGRGEVSYQPQEPPATSAIANVLRKHEARLMAIPGVKGVGESFGPVGNPAIQVFIAHSGVAPSIPPVLDGVEVVTTVVGEVDAYPQPTRRRG